MATMGLGEDVEGVKNRRNEHGEFVPTAVLSPKFAVHIHGRFRITCGDRIVLAKNDMFEPSSKIENEPGFDWDAWESDENDGWDAVGNNRYDELCSRYFADEPLEFVVKKATVSRWGDLKVVFENGFVLETFVDNTGDIECWVFFEDGGKGIFIEITGQGLTAEE
ncbi:MAG: hypothetical protein LBI54_10255 [Lachnospiraceae bacterium]|nr:hypothetical protein [Lachnospiraceae bacterium]